MTAPRPAISKPVNTARHHWVGIVDSAAAGSFRGAGKRNVRLGLAVTIRQPSGPLSDPLINLQDRLWYPAGNLLISPVQPTKIRRPTITTITTTTETTITTITLSYLITSNELVASQIITGYCSLEMVPLICVSWCSAARLLWGAVFWLAAQAR